MAKKRNEQDDSLVMAKALELQSRAMQFVADMQHYWKQGVLKPGQCIYVTHDGKREAGVFLFRDQHGEPPSLIEKRIAAMDRMFTSLFVARDKLRGENIMGGCACCGSTAKGSHGPDCVVQTLEQLIDELDYHAE